MPIVPTFESDQLLPGPSGSPSADPNAMAAPARAIAGGMGALSDQSAEFERRYVEAKRMSAAADTIASASQKLGDAQFKWSKVPDRAAATAGFNQDADAIEKDTYANVGDPLVLAHVKERIGQERVIRELDTQSASFDLESSKHRGDLDARMLQYSESAAGATTPELRAKIIDDAKADIAGNVAAGWIKPEEGKQHEIAFDSKVQEVSIRQSMNAALDTQDPRAMDRLAKTVNDPSTFPGLLPETRELLGTRIENMSYRLAMREATRVAHADAMNERYLRQAQSHNETLLLMNTYSGNAPKMSDLEALALHQQISPSGLEAIHSAIDKTAAGEDDVRTVLTLQHAVDTGDATPQDIYGAVAAGKLKTSTSVELMKTLDAKSGKGDNASEKAAFQVLRTGLQGNAIDNGIGVLGQDKEVAAARWATAQAEWNRRVVVGGEDPDMVLSYLLPKYGSTVKPTWFGDLKFGKIGSPQDLSRIALATAKAHQTKQLSDSDYWGQVEILNNWRKYFDGVQAFEDSQKVAGSRHASLPPKSAAPAEVNP